MWMPVAPREPEPDKAGRFWYRCADCDVYGFGKQCWSCHRRKILDRNVVAPWPASGHRHNPGRTDGDNPSCGRIPFEGEVQSLVGS